MTVGEEYTISISITPAQPDAVLAVRTSGGSQTLATLVLEETVRQTVQVTFKAAYAQGKTPDNSPDNADILIYRVPPTAGSVNTVIHQVKLEKGNKATDWTAAPEDGEEAVETKLASVRAQISTEASSIRSEVQATYALATDMTHITQRVGTLSEQTESNYTWSVTRINQLQNDLTNATEATEEELAAIRAYMTFSEDGLVIGKTGNPLTFRVVNDRLAFYMNDTEVAYLSNNKLYVTQAEILTRMVLGKYAFEPQTNGNLSLIYAG